jgi:hypothetical protein
MPAHSGRSAQKQPKPAAIAPEKARGPTTLARVSEVGKAGSGAGNLVRSHQVPNRCCRAANTRDSHLRERLPPGLLIPQCRSRQASSRNQPQWPRIRTASPTSCPRSRNPNRPFPREDELRCREALPPPSRWPHELPRRSLRRRQGEERGEGGASCGGAGLRPCRPDGSDAGERERRM